jgi:hypothetical protein
MLRAEPAGNTQATTPAFYILDLFFRQGGGYANGGAKILKYCGAANPTSTSFCTKCSKAFASASASPLLPAVGYQRKRESHVAQNT